MSFRRFATVAFVLLALLTGGLRPVSADGIVPYETFIKGATPQHGLFTLWHKDGKLYIELSSDQLNRDFVQTIVPSSGVGGQFVVAGNTDHLPSELVRFERADNQVAIVWPNPYFVAPHSAAGQLAIARNFPRTIVGLASIAALDDKTGAVVIDASPFLEDQLNLKGVLEQNIHDTPKADPYMLDRDRTYFGSTKSFPKNVVIEALQDWTSDTQHIRDAIPDPRHLQMHVTYNIADITPSPDYRPRYADDRVGIYDDIYLSFDNDQVISRDLRYLIRWNLQPSDPTKPVSPALHPMIFTMSDTIPEQYRDPIKAAVLKWNEAFLKLGMSDAVQVVDQPNDPTFDPDDIRYNMLRWVTEESASFGADSQTLYDPRTGEEFRTGILISADVPVHAQQEWTYVIDPVRFGRSTDPMPQKFLDDVWLSVIMHETGHNLGMQHNFVGSRAYTAKELQDTSFTAKYGIATTVMEYAPANIWPKPYANGTYAQTVLGPYDYYAMKYAYGPIPGAKTPEDELPALQKIASSWSNPTYRYESDEDVSWADGHAADPRAEQGILTGDMIGWCDVQMKMDHDLMAGRNAYFPQQGEAFEAETQAFRRVFGGYTKCAMLPAHYIGGQYLSRAHRGDPGAQPPIVPVPKADQWRAFKALDEHLFSSGAWSLPPSVLQNLGYSEWSGYGYVEFEGYGNLPKWAYDPPARHDYPYYDRIAGVQADTLKEMLSAPVLARIAAGPTETSDPHPMQLSDLFDWLHASIYRELSGHTGSIDPLRRRLQQTYLERLIALYSAPEADAPADARALARAELVLLERQAGSAAAHSADPASRAHLDLLRARAHQSLSPR
jgi:hypothetical protein